MDGSEAAVVAALSLHAAAAGGVSLEALQHDTTFTVIQDEGGTVDIIRHKVPAFLHCCGV